MAVVIRQLSRLVHARLIRLDAVEHWQMPEYPEVPEAADDISHVVADNERVDQIATRYYGAPELWWVIALANGWRLVPNDVVPGRTIRIPSPARVQATLIRRRQQP